MVKAKVEKITLNGFGSHLGMEKGCFTIKDKEGNTERYPLFEQEIGEVILKSGNSVSVGALASLGFWEIDCLILTQKGKPVAMLRSLEDYSHVKTRICQYKALNNGKKQEIAKQIVSAKCQSQNLILRKYGLRQHDIITIKKNITESQTSKTLIGIEGTFTKHYFKEILKLFPKTIRTENRVTFKAYDGLNNTFNLAYSILKWKVETALIKAKLEPYLGFLHSEQFGKPALVCDFIELYRYLIDDFLIQYCQSLKVKDFTVKSEWLSKGKMGKREYLNNAQTSTLMKRLNQYFEDKVEIPRIKHGNRQTLETLINEEALLLAKYLRNERETWTPRISLLPYSSK